MLYKIDIYKCKILNSIIKCNLLKNSSNYFYIWDNSPNPVSDSDKLYIEGLGKNIVYDSHIDNIPLAKVYNSIIEKYSFCDYIVIFDQDTELLDYNYEKILDFAIEKNPMIDLFIPKIYTKSGCLYSPGKVMFPGKAMKINNIQEGVVKARKLTGITSGIIISNQYIKNTGFRFNEKLKLYGVDTDLFYNYKEMRKFLYVLPVNISHSLSFEDESLSLDIQWKRDCERLDCLFSIYKHFYERFFCHLLKVYYILRYKPRYKKGIKR